MLRTPTHHIVEIGTNTTSTTTTATTPLIEHLQAGTKYQYHDYQQYNTKTNINKNKTTTTTTTVKQLQQSFIFHHHQHTEKEKQNQKLSTKEYQLQQKQLQTVVATCNNKHKNKNNNKKLKKSKKSSISSFVSIDSSSTISSLSSSGCSALSVTSSDDSSTSTVSGKTAKTNSSTKSSSSRTSSSATSNSSATFTFKEHFLLSRALLSTTPFSFMRTKKAKTDKSAIQTPVATIKTTPTKSELRKKSKRLFDFEDNNNKNKNKAGGNTNSETIVAAPLQETNSATKEVASRTTTETNSIRTGYFANILNNSSNYNNNNNNTNTKNITYNNNNNNYLKTSLLSSPSIPSAAAFTTAVTSSCFNSNNNKPITVISTTTTAACVVAPSSLVVAVAVASPPIASITTTATISSNVLATTTLVTSMSPTSQTPPSARTSLFDSCHRKIRLIGGGPVAFLGGLVAKARRKERDGDQNSTDTKLYLEESVLERKLPEADLKALVDLPAGLDYNEWLASHTLALFEHVNLVYGTISEFCTTSGCPDMTGPGNRTYLWFDEKGKKTRVAAPQYIDYVMTFTQKTVSDESIFPTKYANELPSSFESIARKILRLQFHVIAHLYAGHFREIVLLGLYMHLNLTFAHLTALYRRFNLIGEKKTDVMRVLEVALRLTDDTTGGNGASDAGTKSGSSQNDATETNLASSGGGGIFSSKSGSLAEDVTSVQQNNLMDCNTTAQPPICTQPEANVKSQQFGRGGGNTSSNPSSTPNNTCSTNSTCVPAEQQQQRQQSSTVGAVTENATMLIVTRYKLKRTL